MKSLRLLGTLLLASSLSLFAAELMPNLGSAPAGWTVDRAAPERFESIGGYAGHHDVVALKTDLSLPADYQGMKYGVTGGLGSTASADLYVDKLWSTPKKVMVDTSLWVHLVNAAGETVPYAILGFGNSYGEGVFKAWTWDWENYDPAGGDINYAWRTFDAPVSYNAWNSLSISFDDQYIHYFINGAEIYTDFNLYAGVKAVDVSLEAYNWGNEEIGESFLPSPGNKASYTVHWSNSVSAPEASATLPLLALTLGLALVIRRRRA